MMKFGRVSIETKGLNTEEEIESENVRYPLPG